jgi:hypothetical protein
MWPPHVRSIPATTKAHFTSPPTSLSPVVRYISIRLPSHHPPSRRWLSDRFGYNLHCSTGYTLGPSPHRWPDDARICRSEFETAKFLIALTITEYILTLHHWVVLYGVVDWLNNLEIPRLNLYRFLSKTSYEGLILQLSTKLSGLLNWFFFYFSLILINNSCSIYQLLWNFFFFFWNFGQH